MRIYLSNVYDEALRRIRWLYDNLDKVIVSFSGGKDSTIVLNLALKVAEEKGKLPLEVVFLDQEAEWQAVIDYMRRVKADPRIDLRWLQVPFRLSNNADLSDSWLYCWEKDKPSQWMREKEPDSIHENVYGADRFYDMFPAYCKKHYPSESVGMLIGMRGEESPSRLLGLTAYETFKGETWGKVMSKRMQHFTFAPLYDWTWSDVWVAIHRNKWDYCEIYDYQFRYGIPVSQMRVSSLTHETALKNLFYMPEVERETWVRMTKRLEGVNTAIQLKEDFLKVEKLPFMFRDWKEYRDFLVQKLIAEDKIAKFLKVFKEHDEYYSELNDTWMEKLYRFHITCIMSNDFDFFKAQSFFANTNTVFVAYQKWKRGKKLNAIDQKLLMKGLKNE